MRFYGYDSMPGAPGNNLASTSFVIPGGAAVGKPLLPNMPELKQKGRRDPSFPPEESIPFVVPGAMLPGAGIMPIIGNVGGIPGAVGNMGGVQEFKNELNKLQLPQNIRGSNYRYEQEIEPPYRKFVY